jgi:hypothetical protein
MSEQPIFEVFYKNGTSYKIYEDGNIEGFPDPENAMIRNRIFARMSVIQGQKILLLQSLKKIQQISLEADRTEIEQSDLIVRTLITNGDLHHSERQKAVEFFKNRGFYRQHQILYKEQIESESKE